VLDVEDWAEIRRLRRAEGLAISEIARVMGVARNTVKAALAADGRRSIGGCCEGRWWITLSRGSGSC
jgi:DNA-directed RNA polymerase specialized sigma24 family protein